jgi:hypothetical protein
MNLITQRMLIRNVAKRWRKQYEPFKDHAPLFSARMGLSRDLTKQQIAEKLDALDGETATADDVANIIGSGSWTRMVCHECGRGVNAVVEVGEAPGYESATANLCRECAEKAAAIWLNARSQPPSDSEVK